MARQRSRNVFGEFRQRHGRWIGRLSCEEKSLSGFDDGGSERGDAEVEKCVDIARRGVTGRFKQPTEFEVSNQR